MSTTANSGKKATFAYNKTNQPLFTLLLQADTAIQAAENIVATPEKISFFALLKEGGVLMIPLFLCSIVAAYIFFERFFAIRKSVLKDENFMGRIRELIVSGNLQGAKSLCRNTNAPEARMIEKGINRIGKPIEQIEKSMETIGKQEVYKLDKNVSILSTIASIAPMFGFLGTIFGMIILFFNIQHSNSFSPESLAGGIYTKMVTSATGLIIGLISYVAYKYINAQINKQVNRMEIASSEFLDILMEPAK